VTFHNGDLAEMATWVTGVKRVDARTVTIAGEDPIALFRTFITVVLLTRAIVE
jgi:D-amino peptidase